MRVTISIVGHVSTGKSSFINSLVGYPIANVSLQRETFAITRYIYSKNCKLENYDNMGVVNKQLRIEKTAKISLCEKVNHIPFKFFGNEKIEIVDYPGIDDSDERFAGYFDNILDKLAGSEIIIFITDANRAFQSILEKQNMEKLQKKVIEWNAEGKFITILILVNKYDFPLDTDLQEIFDYNVNEKFTVDRTFKYCAYAELKRKLKSNLILPKYFLSEMAKIKSAVESNGDYDHLDDYISNYISNFSTAKGDFIYNYLMRYAIKHINTDYDIIFDLLIKNNTIISSCFTHSQQIKLFTTLLINIDFHASNMYSAHFNLINLIFILGLEELVELIIEKSKHSTELMHNIYTIHTNISINYIVLFKPMIAKYGINQGSYLSIYKVIDILASRLKREIIKLEINEKLPYKELALLRINVFNLINNCWADALGKFSTNDIFTY